jgi:hypothetical protein
MKDRKKLLIFSNLCESFCNQTSQGYFDPLICSSQFNIANMDMPRLRSDDKKIHKDND